MSSDIIYILLMDTDVYWRNIGVRDQTRFIQIPGLNNSIEVSANGDDWVDIDSDNRSDGCERDVLASAINCFSGMQNCQEKYCSTLLLFWARMNKIGARSFSGETHSLTLVRPPENELSPIFFTLVQKSSVEKYYF